MIYDCHVNLNNRIISEKLRFLEMFLASIAKFVATFRLTKSNGLGKFNNATEPLKYVQKLMTVYHLNKRRKIPEDQIPQTHRCNKLKCRQ
jgi:hypothetical protein